MSARRNLPAGPQNRRSESEAGSSNPLVRKLQGLVSLTAWDVVAVEEISAHPRLLGPDVDIIRTGIVPEDVVLVLEGFACRYKQRQTGRRQIIAFLLPGDFCDVDMLHHGAMDHAVGTLSPCLVARIPRQRFTHLIEHHPNIAHALHRAKRAEEATLREWIMNLGCRTALERMAHLFCELMSRFEMVGLAHHGTCPLPLTQVDLADTLGLSNVHVNRTLQDLRRQGLVELRGKSLSLLDPPRLRNLAEFRPAYLQPQACANAYANL